MPFRNYILLLLFITLTGSLHAQERSYRLPKNIDKNQYSAQTIIVKFKTTPEGNLSGRSFGKTTIQKSARAIASNNKKAQKHPLANIFKINLEQGQDIEVAINDFLKDDNVLYAEPYFNHRPLFIPNDPDAAPGTGAQDYLEIIEAYDAWTIERGDSTVVIGVLDSGVQPDHPDLYQQIAYNLDDPVNGIDDDNDGLIDNFIGWDIADNDNNPVADTDSHGTEVTATSSARTNNGEGMAGTGFNSKFMPIKTFRSGNDAFNMGYEAIALAADLGCKVLNLSWGAPNSFSQFGQDVINYAVLEKDVIIVAAAGNTNEQLDFYPASFDNVLSVGATNIMDEKAFFATYSYFIDLMAPGEDIFTATNNSTYVSGKIGTSYSAPMVAGAAALLRARFPDLTAQQIMERLRVTADDIYSVGSNNSFEGLLGKGRLNMSRALTDDTPALRIDSLSYTNGLGEFAYFEDTLSISVRIKNYLSTLTNATATLTSNSPYVSFIDSEMEISSIGTLETLNNFDLPFRIVLSENTPPDEAIVFRLDFEGLVYSDFEYFTLRTSAGYTSVTGNQLSMTVSSDGDLGYDENDFFNGEGVLFQGEKIADNLGLILAFRKDSVTDNAPTNFVVGSRDEDFETEEPLKRYSNSGSPTDLRSVFKVNDSIRLEQTFLTNNSDDFIIQQYRVVNTSNTAISNLSIGIYADWNIDNPDLNQVNWLGAEKLGYVHNTDKYVGIALMSNQDSVYFAVDNKNFNGNSADIPSVLNDSVKYYLSSQGIFKTTAGTANGGNDVSHFIGADIPMLNSHEAQKVIFAMVAGESLEDLVVKLNVARLHLLDYVNQPPIAAISETCLGEPATIDPTSGDVFDFYADAALTNLLFNGTSFTTSNLTAPQTYYVVNKDNAYPSDVFRVIAKPKLVNAAFEINPDPLLLEEGESSLASFTDQSIDGVSWTWNFDNGFTANIQNPAINYSETGTYNVELHVTNDLGCEETITKDLLVANRSNRPNIANQFACKNETLTLEASNASSLEFYADQELTTLIGTGNPFQSSFNRDTTLYVISVDSTFASNPTVVTIDIDDVIANFNYAQDTTDLSSPSLINFTSTSSNNELAIWYNQDEFISREDNFTFDYQNSNSLSILLVVESINSCIDSLEVILPFEESPLPEPQVLEVCEGESTSIIPGGSYLHFYTDEALTQLVAKGSRIDLDSVKTDTTFYVTSNQNFIESVASEFHISVSDIKADFSFSANPINLSEVSIVELVDQSTAAVQWLWTIDGDTLSVAQNTSFSPSNIGRYNIQLSIEDELGCIDSLNQSLEVINVTSLDDEFSFLIYPNPVTDKLFIQSKEKIKVQLFDQNGKLVKSIEGTNPALHMRSLPGGTYYLEVQSAVTKIRRKIIKAD